ncbi:DNA topoisomerase 1, partial [Haemophilus influenzae]
NLMRTLYCVMVQVACLCQPITSRNPAKHAQLKSQNLCNIASVYLKN